MPLHLSPNQKNRKRGYAAHLVCGVCAALNLLAYLPPKAFEGAEATEFTVTIFLLLIFIVAGLFAAISTLKNRGDIGLLSLLILSVAFVMVSTYGSAWEWKTRIALHYRTRPWFSRLEQLACSRPVALPSS
jgi:hypothetical protein